MRTPGTWRGTVLRTVLRASAALPLVLAAWALSAWMVGPLGQGIRYLVFYPAVVLAMFWEGLPAGLCATLLSSLVAFFWIPRGQEADLEPVAMGIYVVSCLLICRLLESRRQALLGRQQAGTALAESEHRYQALFNSMQEGFSLREVITDAAGIPVDYRFLAVNPTFAAMMGRTEDQMVGHAMREFLPGIDPFWAGLFGRVALTGEAARVEHFEPAQERWYQINAFCPEPGQVAVLSLDVTWNMRVEEERFQAIFEHSPIAVGWQDLDGCCRAANPAFQRMLGYAREELVGLHFSRYIHPETLEQSLQLRAAMLRGEAEEIVMENRWIRKDGETIRVSLSVRPIHDAAGAFAFTFCMAEDITERRRVEEALRASEEKYSTLFKILPVGVVTLDAGRRLMDINSAGERILGLSQADRQAWTQHPLAWNRLRPDGSPMPRNESPGPIATRTGTAVENVEMGIVRPDGSVAWILVSTAPIPVKDFGVASTFVDITARRQTEAALASERVRYKSIMDIAQDAIYIVDPQGNLVACNAAFLAGRGYNAGDVPSLRISDWNAMGYPEQLASRIQALIEQPGVRESRHRRKDGSVFEVEINAGRVELEGKPHLMAAARDITARKALERERSLRQSQLEELNRSLEDRVRDTVADIRRKDQMLITQNRHAAMGEMIGHIAHQWRQPLNALSMLLANLEDAERFGGLGREKLERALAKGDLLIQKMSSTINDFGNFFKPAKALTAFSALRQVQAAVALVEAGFEAGNISIRIEAPADVTLRGYPNEYSQVLLNLLSNARQAIQDARVQAGVVTIRLARTDRFGCLTLSDNGGGIPEQLLDRIFEPYFSTREAGTGIGLTMSRQIIEQNMNGRITARNVEGGAEFTIQVVLWGEPD
jgi:PAS domain S-box-containing protein